MSLFGHEKLLFGLLFCRENELVSVHSSIVGEDSLDRVYQGIALGISCLFGGACEIP